MNDFINRFSILLINQNNGTADLRSDEDIFDGVIIYGIYTFLTALAAFIESITATGSVGASLIIFIGMLFLNVFLWLIISAVFRILAGLFGGEGGFTHSLRFVGLAAAPMIITTVLVFIITLLSGAAAPEDAEFISVVKLAVNVLGMAWGIPGLICYYGLKNAELLEAGKALTVTLIVFVVVVGIELFLTGVV
jgi:hypothetical protein